MLAWFGTAIGGMVLRYGAIALAIGAAVTYIDRRATYRERAKCEAAAKEAERLAGVQDDTAAKNALANANSTIGELSKQQELDRVALQSLKDQLAREQQAPQAAHKGDKLVAPSRGCYATDDDVKRLR